MEDNINIADNHAGGTSNWEGVAGVKKMWLVKFKLIFRVNAVSYKFWSLYNFLVSYFTIFSPFVCVCTFYVSLGQLADL